MANDVNNVGIQQDLNKLLENQKRILRESTREIREQAALTQQMADSLTQADLRSDILEKTRILKDSLKGASDQARNLGKNNQDMASLTAGALAETDDGFSGLMATYAKATGSAGKWGALTGGFIEGLSKGVRLLRTGLRGILSLAGSVVQGVFSIGKAILAIPFKIFNAFIAEANRLQGEPLLAREFEETRRAFGDFHEDLSKYVIGGYRNLRGELAETGLSVYRVLGYRHEQLKFIREQFEALGPIAHQFGMEIAAQAEHFAAYQKGLGLSGEMMKGLAQSTQGTGETFEETLRTTTKFTTSLGRQFGISQKVIGRDVGEMAKDLKTFGSVGVRQMAQMSTFARKLGADFKDLLGIVSKFDDFEDAAESAARLAQAFGLNVDAMEMINEQDPAARVERLRKAFFQTGKDITKLTRQERNYLAQTAGIEDQALNAVFALENQGKTYEEVAAAGQTAEQQQITQAEAMERLSDSIERMIKSGRRTGGFFDRFMKGFRRGVRWSSEFWKVMRNIRRSLWATERAGRVVGRIFVKAFPGIKQFLKGMAQLFDPTKFKNLGRKVKSAFADFEAALKDPKTAKNALKNFVEALRKAFMEMIGSQKDAMGNIIGGLKDSFKAIGTIILSGLKIAAQNLTKLFKALTKIIKGESDIGEAFKEAFGKAGEQGANALLDVWFEVIKELGPVAKKLWSAFKELLSAAWQKLQDWAATVDWGAVFKKISPAIMAVLGVVFGPAMINAVASALGNALFKGIKRALKGGGGAKGLFTKYGKQLGAAGGVAIAVTAAIGIDNGLKKFEKELTKSFGRTESKVGASIAGIVDILTFGLLPDQLGLNLAETIAQASTFLFKAMDDYFGTGFGKEFRKLLGGWLDFAGALGNLIQTLFTGDKDQIKDAAKDLGKKLFTYLVQWLKFTITELPGALLRVFVDFGSWVGETTFSILSGVLEGLAEMVGEIPLFGPYVKEQIMWLSWLYGKVAEIFDQLPKLFRKVVGYVQPFKEGFMNAIGSLFKEETWIKLGNAIVTGVKKALSNLGQTMKQPFVDAKEDIFNFFGIASPSKMFMQMGKDMLGGLQKGIDQVPAGDLIKDHGMDLIKNYKNFMEELVTISAPAGTGAEIVKGIEQTIGSIPENVFSSQAPALMQDYEKLVDIVKASVGGPAGKVSLGDIVNFDVKETGAAKGISKMVKSANMMHKQLADVNQANLRPKLENLGKTLGLKGNESLRIEHENFNVDINVTVELDPTKLADAIVDTGKVVKAVKAPRK